MIAKAILVTTKGGHSTIKIQFGKTTAARLSRLHKVSLHAEAGRPQRIAQESRDHDRGERLDAHPLIAPARLSPRRFLRLSRAFSRNTKCHSAASSR